MFELDKLNECCKVPQIYLPEYYFGAMLQLIKTLV